MLKKGFKWILGDGKSIRLFADPWVRGKDDFMVDNTFTGVSGDIKVGDLFLPGEDQWDANKVNNLVTTRYASLILAMPIPKCQVPDRMAWMSTSDGKYSVKSGYKFWRTQCNEGEVVADSSGWGKLWKLMVPHKMRVFLWRICRNNLPVRNLLRGKGVQANIVSYVFK